ncbi:hypothetical protein [Candidatus Uabimicrobium sp. HlEnr_7]|uniref:hypothetical protein n=1 Tax=Candidatus Uabimicrobium helgolandensis TaxID=3095367 RepID=UPI0035580715
MEFLNPQQVNNWFQTSLQYSGYQKLDKWSFVVWRDLVELGYCCFPPGLVAKILRKLTHRSVGTNFPKEANLEDKLVNIIVSGKGFSLLEGEFLIAKEENNEKCLAVTKRIAEKSGSFYHPQILFSVNDVDQALATTKSDDNFSNTLEDIYQKAISHLVKNNESIDENDIFEITHPQLFVSPTARSLFQKMVFSQKHLRENIAGEITPVKENDEVAAVFGEPQSLPLGGYDSITRKGDIASLVPSELAYIEENEVIDYFDYKYMQNELMYFKREEGIVFRIRRQMHLFLLLDHEMEHERNLADLFAFVLVFCEKIFNVFVKDIIAINIYFQGDLPSEIKSAISFLQHYLEEGNYQNQVQIYINSGLQIQQQEKKSQHWYLGPDLPEIQVNKKIDFLFPGLENLTKKNRVFFLADLIDDLVEKITSMSYY